MNKNMLKILIACVACTLIMSASVFAHEELPDELVEVTVTATNGGRVYCDGDNWSALTGLEMEMGTEITLEATEHRGKFVYWKDELSNKIVSDNPIYTLTLTGDINLTAFFLPDSTMGTYGYVTFADINGRIYLSNYAVGDSAKAPNLSWVENPGYELTGWDSDGWKNVEVGEIHLVRTVYEKKDVTFSLEVEGGIAEPARSSYSYDSAVLLTADLADIPEGKVFAGWEINGEVVSYDKSFGFRMACDTVAKAVYADEAPQKLPITAIIDVDTDVYSKGVSVLTLRNVPSGAEVVESGILFAYGEGSALTLDNTSATRVKAIGNERVGMYRYNKNLGAGAKLRAVSYIVYKSEGTLYVAYSGEKTITG